MPLLADNRKTRNRAPVPQGRITPQDFDVFQEILYRQSGIVLSDAKQALVESRVTRRLRALRIKSHRDYLHYLAQDSSGKELVHLIDAISTNITEFFREPDHFEMLDGIVAGWTDAGQRRLRFWSAGCSTGEEPYSMAMVLQPYVERCGLDLKILATDISTRVLAHASEAVYDRERLHHVSADLRGRYFRPRQDGERYALVEPLKRHVMLRRLNFNRIPYPINGVFDAIFCRNAMIYFDQDLRNRMVNEFARLLKPDGYLFIGHSETLIGRERKYRRIKPSVYQRLEDGGDA